MARYELTDDEWNLLKGLFPKQKRGGKWNDHRTTLNGMLWILRSGAPWRDMPERYGKWKSVYHRFNRWRREGVSRFPGTRSLPSESACPASDPPPLA